MIRGNDDILMTIDPCLMGEVAASPGTRPTASSLGGVSSWSTALSVDAGLEFIKVFLFWSGPTEARGDNPVMCKVIMFVYQSHLLSYVHRLPFRNQTLFLKI